MDLHLKNIEYNLLSNAWAKLHRVDFDFKFKNGKWKRLSRECYDRGDGTSVLLYNTQNRKVILTKQFRMPAFINCNNEGMSIEVCAGALDKDESPETCIVREIEEEVGIKIETVEKVMETYMSPGAVTEKMHLFIAQYADDMKVSCGGGLETEDEEIEVLEINIDKALEMIEKQEIKDAKTILLLQYVRLNKII
jgi:GDP-mannose pyrophosphatase NudK